jgi:hypothetical protein
MSRVWVRGWALLLVCLLGGCGRSASVPELDEIGPTLDAIGRRLSGSLSESKLTALAARGPALLTALSRRERDILARGYLRVHSRVALVVDVAAPLGSEPFWLGDQGFAATGVWLANEDAKWGLFRRSFPAGWIGLGVNGMDRSPPAHYAVFLRAAPGRPPLRGDELTLDEQAAPDWSLVAVNDGVSAARDVHRPFLRLPAELEGALLLQPRHDRRHATMLATGRVWKTHVPSCPEPDQVTIAFGADPTRELVWNWRTAPEVEGTAIRLVPAGFQTVEDGTQALDIVAGARIEKGTCSLVRSPGVLNDPVMRRHAVKVSGLSPDTTYLYSLGDGASGSWAPWRAVKTGRAGGGRIEFLYMGDVQTGLEAWGRRLAAAFRRHPAIEFILLAGDLVDRGNERTNWDHFFLRAEQIFERVPVMPAAGNHEYLEQGPRLFRSNFTLPENGPGGDESGLIYHFEYGSACIAVLDSTAAVSDLRRARRQARWLDELLSKTSARWKLVMFHHPVYPSHPWRETPLLREEWVPVFDKHHVDLVLQGHDHAYLRTYPLRGGQPVEGAEQGTIYVIAVAGDKFCDQRDSELAEVGFTRTSTYQTIEIDDVADRLTYRAWTDTGEVVDQVVIAKSKPAQPELARRERGALR